MSEASLSIAEISIPNERTVESFWATKDWALKSRLTHEVFLRLWYMGFDEYDVELEAHNFEHGSASLWLVNEIADIYEEAGALEGTVDRKILNASALLNDAGKNKAYLASGCATKEIFAAKLAGDILPYCGYDPTEIKEVQAGILSTAKDGILDTPLKKILGIADLYNVGSEEAVFKARTGDFLAETKSCEGKSFERQKFMADAILILGLNLTKDLTLKGIGPMWLNRTMINFRGMVLKFAHEDPDCLPIALKAGGTALRKIVPTNLVPQGSI